MAAALSRLGWGPRGTALPAPPMPAATAGAPPAAAQAAVVFLLGDRVPPAALGERAARLQQPAAVASVLTAKFPGAAVLVALPQRYQSDAACYDAFLPGPLCAQGLPRAFSAAGFPAARALAALLAAGGLPAAGQPLPPLVLLGFSKAGVVLHQVLSELAEWQREAGGGCAPCTWQQRRQQQQQQQRQQAPQNQVAAWQEVLTAVRDVFFLDAGATRRGAAHPMDPSILQQLGQRCSAHALRLHLHGTPRQWRDPGRPWLGREAAGLAAAAAAAGVPCTLHEHWAGQAPSLDQHFATIDAFEPQG